MWTAIGLIVAYCLCCWLLIKVAKSEGSKAAKLEALKAELRKRAEEERRAEQISNNVYNLTDDDARERLHHVANDYAKRNGMQ